MENPGEYQGVDFPFTLPEQELSPDDCPVADSMTVPPAPEGGFSAFQVNIQLVRSFVNRDAGAGFLPGDFTFQSSEMTAEQIVQLISRQKQRRCRQMTAERKGWSVIPGLEERAARRRREQAFMDSESPPDPTVSLPTFEGGPDLAYDPVTDDMQFVLYNEDEDTEFHDWGARFEIATIDPTVLATLYANPRGSFHSLAILNYMATKSDALFPTHVDPTLETQATKANILNALEGMWEMWETDPAILVKEVPMTVLVEDRLECSMATDSRAPLFECKNDMVLAIKLMEEGDLEEPREKARRASDIFMSELAPGEPYVEIVPLTTGGTLHQSTMIPAQGPVDNGLAPTAPIPLPVIVIAPSTMAIVPPAHVSAPPAPQGPVSAPNPRSAPPPSQVLLTENAALGAHLEHSQSQLRHMHRVMEQLLGELAEKEMRLEAWEHASAHLGINELIEDAEEYLR